MIGTVAASDKSRRDFPAGWEDGTKLWQGREERLRTRIHPTFPRQGADGDGR